MGFRPMFRLDSCLLEVSFGFGHDPVNDGHGHLFLLLPTLWERCCPQLVKDGQGIFGVGDPIDRSLFSFHLWQDEELGGMWKFGAPFWY